jgi:hypothetical protein
LSSFSAGWRYDDTYETVLADVAERHMRSNYRFFFEQTSTERMRPWSRRAVDQLVWDEHVCHGDLDMNAGHIQQP